MSVSRSETPRSRRLPKSPSAAPQSPVAWETFFLAAGKLDRAVNDLRRRAPQFSAATRSPLWQRILLLLAPSAVTAGLIGIDHAGDSLCTVALALPFLMVAGIRIAAVCHAFWHVPEGIEAFACDRRFDDRLPSYSVLVPLYKEQLIVPGLVQAMARLDYPGDRLEILFVTEEDDQPTRNALIQAGLRSNMRIVTVPTGQPRTKPRALNYALQDARGMLVAVYDAEDIPETDQLRRAAEAFIEGGPRLACVQAQLGIYNGDQSFFSRQFALEYSALFRGLLPALEYLNLPIPLGGTSNHFRRDLLLKCGGWDPYNVTEDADLGIRLARLGYEVSIIHSETSEEAPATWKTWRGQRTRWIKGWMQTYLVHMRRPVRLWRDLGGWRFAGFQVIIGGMVFSILVHPWFYVLALMHGLGGGQVTPSGAFLRWVCGVNLATGYCAAWLLTFVTAMRSGSPLRLISAIWLPLYWLAISWAAYRALVEFIFKPFHWEKTTHGLAGSHQRDARKPNRKSA
ncbi:glycosyltransferase family 2 protein [Hyphomicrobium sp.]|uniref:glycosyltransferase family 2 protein n=1 Tax=Hyphomicrobium sp. TaxID=82 RepID=UPI002CB3283A|nr:glycosyltransferase family 2 protein [Hyphomicrobium sp.]HVZ05705.1 glycosyltransferase family 2 protein [Hyphomicrobium sp.]